jgi:hypothetical protein
MNPRSPRLPLALVALLASALAAACSGGSSDSNSFEVQTTLRATTAAHPPVVTGNWAVYYADETASGLSDLNGDGDTTDTVACLIHLKANTDTVLGVSAVDAAISDNEIYLAVSEDADQQDWNVDGDEDDLVLLHWRDEQPLPPVYVDTLEPSALDEPLLASGDRIYYAAAMPGVLAGETTLRFVSSAEPLVPESVYDADGEQLVARPHAVSNGLLFVTCDEVQSALNLNGDGDSTDARVLALLDTTEADALLKVVGLALSGPDTPVSASATDSNDWTVAFLVSEAAQDADLDDPALFPPAWIAENCGDTADGITGESVLHWLSFASWFDATSAPVNTGLAGALRVIAFDEAVATLMPEDSADCDLDGDGDVLDFVPRWVDTSDAALPAGAVEQMIAVRRVAGGAEGLAWNGQRLVAVLSEELSGQDLDTSAELHDLVAWLDPADGAAATWHVQHSTGIGGTGIPGVAFVGADWMAEKPLEGRLGLGFEEHVAGDLLGEPNYSINNCLDSNLYAKDADDLDSLPVWSDFTSGPELDFDGIGYALATNNAGIVVARGTVFFRGNEQNDNYAYDDDGDMSDDVLFRNPVAAGCQAEPMSAAAALDQPVVYTDGVTGACFFCDEGLAGQDLNLDGDTDDLVLRYFRL